MKGSLLSVPQSDWDAERERGGFAIVVVDGGVSTQWHVQKGTSLKCKFPQWHTSWHTHATHAVSKLWKHLCTGNLSQSNTVASSAPSAAAWIPLPIGHLFWVANFEWMERLILIRSFMPGFLHSVQSFEDWLACVPILYLFIAESQCVPQGSIDLSRVFWQVFPTLVTAGQ